MDVGSRALASSCCLFFRKSSAESLNIVLDRAIYRMSSLPVSCKHFRHSASIPLSGPPQRKSVAIWREARGCSAGSSASRPSYQRHSRFLPSSNPESNLVHHAKHHSRRQHSRSLLRATSTDESELSTSELVVCCRHVEQRKTACLICPQCQTL